MSRKERQTRSAPPIKFPTPKRGEDWERGEEDFEGPLHGFAQVLLRNRIIWSLLFVVVLSLLFSNQFQLSYPDYQIGDIARSNIKAPLEIQYPDEEATEKRRSEARELVLPLYDYDASAKLVTLEGLQRLFESGRQTMQKYLEEYLSAEERARYITDKGLERAPSPLPDALKASLKEALPELSSETVLDFLSSRAFDQDLEDQFVSLAASLLERDVVANRELLLKNSEVSVRNIDTQAEQKRTDFTEVIDYRHLGEEIEARLGPMDLRKRGVEEAVGEFFKDLIFPNLTFNKSGTERRRSEAAQKVEPLVGIIPRGKIIVREGEEIGALTLEKIGFLRQATRQGVELSRMAGLAVLLTGLLSAMWLYVRSYGRYHRRVKDLFVLLVSLSLIISIICRFAIFVAESLAASVSIPPLGQASLYYYAVPFSAGAMLVTLLIDRQIALLFSIVMSLFAGILTGGDFNFVFFALIGSFAAIYSLTQYKRRTALIRAGGMVGLVNVATVCALRLHSGEAFLVSDTALQAFCAFAGGILVAPVVSFLLPVLEAAFDILTDIKLLEMSDVNHPLIRELAIRAPGTYNHSVIVGNLTEAAAESIGGNALFCRVAAYYHDIGKLYNPEYFIENQTTGENKHKKLKARMSALILINHVKKGLELAKREKLPKSLRDIIPQHHGTRLITYFYEKAKKQEDPKREAIKEEEYRYPGPKPQTREAAIFMLADGVEAASRSMKDHSVGRLKGLIKEVCDRIVIDGQLDQCNLTFRDLENIQAAFLRILVGMSHHRVKYPGYEFEGETKAAEAKTSEGKASEGKR